MRPFLFTFFVLSVMPFTLNAQRITQWDIKEPIHGTIMGVSFDYTETDFNGSDYLTFCQEQELAQQLIFEEEKLEDEELRFIREFNESMLEQKVRFLLNRENNSVYKYTFIIHPKSFSKYGTFYGYFTIVNSSGETVVSSDDFSGGRAGVYGSFVNLIGDGYEKAADRIRFTISTFIKKNRIK